ncbi:MAG: RagB/SusD family nutrient uptake outer membrane protein [Bacteroidota bacterium]
MKPILKIVYIFIIMGGLAMTGCKKSMLELQNQSAYTYETYFANDDAMNQAVIAAYATLLHNGLYSRDYYFIFDLLGNDAERDAPLLGDLLQLAQYNFGANNTQIQDLWGSLYRMVFRANVVIDRANVWEPATPAEEAHKRQYIAEAKFLKSFANFNLVNLWGRVPLHKDYESTVADNYPARAPVADIWATIEQDLKEAIPDLPLAYDDINLGRTTQGAAVALLGKTYLYQQKWQDAQDELKKLTQAPFSYSLVGNYDDLFSTTNQSNTETIFQVMHQLWTDWGIGNQYYMFGGQETWGLKATHSDRAQEYGFNDWRNVFISDAAVNAFTYPNPSNGNAYIDPRAQNVYYGEATKGGDLDYCNQCAGGAIAYPFADANGGYRWRKYEYYESTPQYGGPQSPINSEVIRYADVLLMLAETYIQQGNTGTEALNLINEVRDRAGAIPYSTLGDPANAKIILMRERQIELSGEQSRYFDLIRWGLAKQTLNAEKQIQMGSQPFQDKNVLLPIPQQEKDANPNVANDIQDNWN